MPTQSKIEKLLAVMENIDEGTVHMNEVVDIFEAIVGLMKEMRTDLQKEMKSGLTDCQNDYQSLEKAFNSCESRLSALISSSSKETLLEANRALKSEVALIKQAINSIEKFNPSGLEQKIQAVENKIPSLTNVENKIQSLERSEQDDSEAIKKLEEAIKELEKKLNRKVKSSVTLFGGSGGNIRNSFKDIDISDQLDGVTKTFNIPAVWYVISVDTSSSPHALRKTIDYTWTPTSITFTSQIQADSTLAVGETVVLTVVTA